jgi:beta-lysine 5,6-aminomutase alpha subunit
VGKIRLDTSLVERARRAARYIADGVEPEIAANTTTTIERTVLRLLGLNGVDEKGVPLPNVIVERAQEAGLLGDGIAYWLGSAMVQEGRCASEVAKMIARDELRLEDIPPSDDEAVREAVETEAVRTCAYIRARRQERERLIEELDTAQPPYIYVIVATGNIYEDATQAKAAAKCGADIIAVIRSTAQSLLDYVPYGATTEGYGGTYATQANFRIMRQALDEVSRECGRYIRLVNYCSGLCMPEIAAMGAMERLDMMLNDAMYGVLFRDINMRRTFIDQRFSRMINAYAGVIINTGEDNYLTTADAYEQAHTVLASQFINEELALRSGLRPEQIGLGHAFQMDPDMTDGFLCELAQAEMTREIFPYAPLKYMPPTKYMTGNIFKGHLMDAMFNLAGVVSGQTIQLVGVLTEHIHTPFLQDRYLAIENARYVMNNARNLGSEICYRAGGRMEERACEVLRKAAAMLEHVAEIGLMSAISQGMFAGVRRDPRGGRGLDGVVSKRDRYYNPFPALLMKELSSPSFAPKLWRAQVRARQEGQAQRRAPDEAEDRPWDHAEGTSAVREGRGVAEGGRWG